MINLTVRNIPDEVINKIKTLSEIKKRSMNNELLLIIEKGLEKEISSKKNYKISKETQIRIWEKLSGNWADNRTTDEIINDIYSSRTEGRKVEL
jgi:plasmid stability protein